MSFVALAFAYLRRRWGQALLSVLVGALGVSAMAMILMGFDAVPESARRAWGGVDIVVGPKGSALDLVLCCALHVSDPRGLVAMKTAMAAVHSPMVRAAAPIALGDNIDGLRIMGTTPAILDVYRAKLAEGHMWTDKLQAVLGASAARILDLKVGDSFVGAHGLSAGGELHALFPYKVTGILQPTGSALDRLVLTDIETVRYIHVEQAKAEVAERGATDEEPGLGVPDAATAIIASYRSPTAAAFMPRQIDATETLSAASPTFEIARLESYARPLMQAISGLGLLLVFIAAAGAAAGLLSNMNARTRDLALLRALGANSLKIATVAFAEAAMIALAALALGAALTAVLMATCQRILAEKTGLLFTPHLESGQIGMVLAGTAVVVIVAALWPALRAANASVEELLQ